jgi:hypothetical protein
MLVEDLDASKPPSRAEAEKMDQPWQDTTMLSTIKRLGTLLQ